MLQALLAERFAFTFHRETREIDGFALMRTNRDRLGPQLRVSQFDCEKAFSTTHTGLTGRYDIDLHWSNEVAPGTGTPD